MNIPNSKGIWSHALFKQKKFNTNLREIAAICDKLKFLKFFSCQSYDLANDLAQITVRSDLKILNFDNLFQQQRF